MSPRALLAILGLLAVTAPARGQSSAEVPPADPVVAAVRAATTRYQDPAAAAEDGYRRIGPDIPAMGEHWVQVAMLLDPAVDVERPEILAYVPVDGRPRLVGVAWAVALQGDEAPPQLPGVEAPWHAHDGPVEEELLQVGHARHGTGTGSRVAVLHAWVWTPSPAGTYAAENWALPALRLGLPPETERDDEAARALSLARGGHAFLGRQVALLAKLDDDASSSASRILADAGTAVDAVLAGAGPEGLSSGDRLRLTEIWRDARERVAAAAGPKGTAMVRAILGQGSARAATSMSAMPAGAQDARLALSTAAYVLSQDGRDTLPDIDRPGSDAERTCTRALRGTVIGGLAGAGLGLVVTSNWDGRWNVIIATPLAMLGAGVGALIGSSKRRTDCGG